MIYENIYKQLKNNEITELDLFNENIKNIDNLSKYLFFNNSLTELYLHFNKIIHKDK